MTPSGPHGAVRWVALLVLASALLGCAERPSPVPDSEPGTPAPGAPGAEGAALGSEIYLHGRGRGGATVVASLADGAPLPASAVACANCHGPDGRGRAEGGIVPTDVTWRNLTKPYGGGQAGGRQFPPYDAKLLVRAVTLGLDSGGRPLAPTMPRYRLTHEEAAALVAHLRQLGDPVEPGLSPTEMRLGLFGPEDAPEVRAARLVTAAYFDRLNAAGGVYGRKLALVSADLPAGATRVQAAQWLDERNVFAAVGGYPDGSGALTEAAEAARLPRVGLLTAPGPKPGRYDYHLFVGAEDQCRVLAAHAAAEHKSRSARLALVGGNCNPGLADAVRAEWRAGGLAWAEADLPAAGGDAEPAARKLRDAGAALCVLVAPGDAVESFARAAAKLGWEPEFLIPAALAGARLAERPPGRAECWVLAFPTLRGDHTAPALTEFAELARQYRLPTEHRAVQRAALASAKLLVEALNRVGRDLTREKLVAVLESGTEFTTGLTPPLRFGPNRRVGARGAYLARPTANGFAPIGGWRERP